MKSEYDKLWEQWEKGEITEREFRLRSLEAFLSEPPEPQFAGMNLTRRMHLVKLVTVVELIFLGTVVFAVWTGQAAHMVLFYFGLCCLFPLSLGVFFVPASGELLRKFKRWELECERSENGVRKIVQFEGARHGPEFRHLPYTWLLFSIQILPIYWFFPGLLSGQEEFLLIPLFALPIWLFAWVNHRAMLAAPCVTLFISPNEPNSGSRVEGFALLGPIRSQPRQIGLRLESIVGDRDGRRANIKEIEREFEWVCAKFEIDHPIESAEDAEQWQWVVELPLGSGTKRYTKTAVPTASGD